MTILFAGGELGSFTPSDSTVIEAQTALNSGYDPAYARCAMNINSLLSSAQGIAFAATPAIWIHVFMNQSNASPTPIVMLQAFAGAVPVWRLTAQGTLYQMQYWDGAAWQNVGAGFNVPFDNQTYDFQLSTTNIFAYVHGTTKDGAAGAFAQVTNLTRIQFYGVGNILRFSECIVADQPTLGYRLQTLPPTGNGATLNWTGSFNDIKDAITNDGTFIYTGAANQVELFSQLTITTASIRAVVVTARANTTAGAPQNLNLACYSAGVTGFSGNILQGSAFGPAMGVFANDPNTAAAWTNAAVNAMQYGVRSIA